MQRNVLGHGQPVHQHDLAVLLCWAQQVCKLQPELIGMLEQNQCKIRGGVQKKGGKKGKKK